MSPQKTRKPSRREPSEEESDAALDEFIDGSDRVSAILAPLMVENALKAAIESALEDYSDQTGLFFQRGSPFGSFEAKTIGGKALGLFSAEVARDLDLIREIRNQFAHALLPLKFGERYIEEMCQKLRPYPMNGTDSRDIHQSRLKFEVACFKLTTQFLEKSITNLKKKNPPQSALNGLLLNDLVTSGLKGFTKDGLHNQKLGVSWTETASLHPRIDHDGSDENP